ncbi:hypothetical protein WR25_17513 [Diploscapter pachys]|uniref:KASH domain-containing protein n=1 Tax=Diploscapter pachys TaxID=2018661 RepID=A0A2A2L6G3_9BILA|nr:hypothetical protein WR25_17513 [Diploscapter pachys]
MEKEGRRRSEEIVAQSNGMHCRASLNHTANCCSLPVKTLYKTVQIDDASDIEVTKTTIDILGLTEDHLSMSMYVSHDLEQDDMSSSLTEFDEVMALLEDSNSMNNEMDNNESFNTKWREIRGEDKKKKLGRKEDLGAKHSCDASSEESSDCEEKMMEQIMNRSFTFSNDYSTSTPLKRNRSQRGLKVSGNCLFDSDMAASFCSTRSDFSSRGRRKRLRVRRLPRSLSDGEQLSAMTGMVLTSPPTPLASSTRLLQQLDEQLQQSNKDSDTAGDQSEGQVYEWDDYNPPAKDESLRGEEAGMATPKQSSLHLLNIDEDFSSHFNSEMKLHALVEASKAHLRVVEDSLKHVDESQIENIRLISRTNIRQLDAAMKIQRNYTDAEMNELAQLRVQWAKLLDRVEKPMPQLLDKVEQFANSLRELHERSTVSALNGVQEIRTKEDVRLALMAMCQIEERLRHERDELKQILGSKTVAKEIADLSNEFSAISEGYEEAVDRLRKMVETLKGVDRLWTEWAERQLGIRCAMQKIENEMDEGGFDQQKIIQEIGLCEERLNSLETMCNYLTSALYSLQDADANSSTLPDFQAELRLYTNALKELKHRLHEMLRVPSPPSPSVPQEPSPAARKRRSERQTQTISLSTATDSPAPRRSPSTRSIVLLSLLCSLLVLLYLGVYGTTFGPHLTYVNGPPPT